MNNQIDRPPTPRPDTPDSTLSIEGAIEELLFRLDQLEKRQDQLVIAFNRVLKGIYSKEFVEASPSDSAFPP